MTIPLERIKEVLNEKSYEKFIKFMEGQTVESDDKGKTVVFEDDFLRFIKKMEVID